VPRLRLSSRSVSVAALSLWYFRIGPKGEAVGYCSPRVVCLRSRFLECWRFGVAEERNRGSEDGIRSLWKVIVCFSTGNGVHCSGNRVMELDVDFVGWLQLMQRQSMRDGRMPLALYNVGAPCRWKVL